MNKCIDFVVMGEPVAKQRPRVSTFNGYARAYTPKDTINYENKVLNCYLDKLKELNIPKETPYFDRNDLLYVKINIYFTLTKGDYGKKGLNKSGREKIDNLYCNKHKDIDNLCKSVLDGLNGVAYLDDKQVCILDSAKMWTTDSSRVEITIKTINKV